MSTQADKIIELRKKLLDVEEVACNLEDINNIFMPYAAEKSSEDIIIAELLSKQIKALKDIVKF